MESTEARIYSEVYALINLMGITYKNMLPDKVKMSIEEKRDKNYTPEYDENIPIEKQNVQKESLAILANIQYNYWCLSDHEKQDFMKYLKDIDKSIEEQKREKYNPDDIFKKKDNSKQVEDNIVENEVAVINYKESIFKKILNKIKKLVRK